jgi:hypothetical protein
MFQFLCFVNIFQTVILVSLILGWLTLRVRYKVVFSNLASVTASGSERFSLLMSNKNFSEELFVLYRNLVKNLCVVYRNCVKALFVMYRNQVQILCVVYRICVKALFVMYRN